MVQQTHLYVCRCCLSRNQLDCTIVKGDAMKITTVPCLYDNYSYIISDQKSEGAAVVDPSEAWPIIKELERLGLTLTTILCTHHHNDHIGGIDDLLAEYGTIPVIGLGSDSARIPQLSIQLDDGDSFDLCGSSCRLIHTPGHTTGGVVYHLKDHLFTGDTLFGAGCGRLFEGSPEQMLASLRKICACDSDTKLYFGHEYTSINLRFATQVDPGNEAVKARIQKVEAQRLKNEPTTPTTLAEELETNPFLRYQDAAIIQYLEAHHNLMSREPEAVFALIRELRNSFS